MGCTLSRSRRTIRVPPAPAILLSNPRETYNPPRPSPDSPLAAIYRIYWAIVMDDTIAMRNKIEYFWNQKEESWLVKNIPQPPDHEPTRLAIIAAIPFILVAAFNRLIELGLPRDAGGGIWTDDEYAALQLRPKVLETVPQWAEESPPLDVPLKLPSRDIAPLASPETVDDEGADPFMALKNVLVWRLQKPSTVCLQGWW